MTPTTEEARARSGYRQDWRLVGWLALAVLAVVQVFSLYSAGQPGPEGVPGLDKLGHALMFGAPAALAVLMRLPWVLALVTAHALVSEPLQAWLVPTRAGDGWDLLADLVGIALGALLAGWVRGRSR